MQPLLPRDFKKLKINIHEVFNKFSFYQIVKIGEKKLTDLPELFSTACNSSEELHYNWFLCIQNNWYQQFLNFNWVFIAAKLTYFAIDFNRCVGDSLTAFTSSEAQKA